ncbi:MULTISPECIES: phytanoyl-CoA dioxygenase family protein [Pseudomonas]|uniref:phytanoyl-CoA dioxygenase family protein n=1 Tax=Pseudomonas TaxID=286 RepID=UPI000908848A|nr:MULTISPECIES: phytanoyl-CoA dioxygenase family protein [Pseudomonas]NHN69508.1 phytanoyl-CoA dioxygenase family protein [Pseudomonas fluorescens]MDB6445748.1 phytanoyl-CoA dioxygenase family protein [Pseudomonas sp. 21TX0197]MDT8906739.1 phytanoyl-CoA dioxygenase family protein [Pseudomonas prosekii]ROO35092.1 dioxygenase [Pseudomonas sp. 7SR1]ROO42712.1 dioxygenase [Pseudomonas sp. AF76]
MPVSKSDAALTHERLRALHQDGFVLLPAVLGRSQIVDLRRAIDALKPMHWDYSGVIDHYKCVFNRDPFWLPYLDVDGVIELAEAALGDDCHIIGQTAWRCHPGFVGAPLHLDYLMMELPPSLLLDPAFDLPMQIFTAQFYLDDIDADLSPTRVIPGSHRAGRAPVAGETQWAGRSAQPVLCRAGDVLVLRSELWHAGSDNRTVDRSRYLLQVHYGRRMMAQKFSPYLHWQFNPAVLAAATPRQRRLLGDHLEAEYD